MGCEFGEKDSTKFKEINKEQQSYIWEMVPQ